MRYLVLLAFFGSGLSSLILENLWVRMLALVFGGTTLAIVTVLTVFMGGLALGSYLAGKLIHRVKRPLRAYGLMEGSIALYALCVPWMLDFLPVIYRWVPEEWPFLAVAFVRFLLCLLILILPTTLMGATLPLLSQYFVRERKTVGVDVGLLYSVNTFGAVAGALSGGFLLMPLLGITHSLWLVAFGLFSLAVAVLWLDLRIPQRQLDASDDNIASLEEPSGVTFFAEEEDEAPLPSWGAASQEILYEQMAPAQRRWFRRGIVGSLVVTGAAAMICQVIWSRTLSMIIGSSTYAFTLILGIFLMGLAGGAAYGAWLASRSMDVLRSWTRLLLGTGILVALGTLFFDQLPALFVKVALNLPEQISPLLLFSFKAGIAALPIVLPTFLMGTFFPLALALLNHEHKAIGESVGNLYMFNTVGAIVGSAAAGFVVIPLLGLQKGLAACAALYFLCAWGLVWVTESERRVHYGMFASFAVLVVLLLPRWDQGLMSLGTFRLSVLRTYTYQQALHYNPVLFYKEGVSATVTVSGNEAARTLKINGKPEASTSGDRPTQISIAALPLTMHPNPKDVALIGWGSGMTAGAALFFPIRQLIAVELEPVVVEASKKMEPWNYHPLRDKRLQLRYNDGRNYLATTSRKFDVIISEPSNPWISGVSNLFTREYFQLARDRLRPNGIFCQWVQLYEISSRNVASILRSIHSVFPHVRLFEVTTNDTDTYLLASMKPWEIDLKRLQQAIQHPKLGKLFRHAEILSAHDLIPRFLLGEYEIPALLKRIPAPLNTDAHNILEFTAPLDLVNASAYRNDTPFQKAVNLLGRPYSNYFRHPDRQQPVREQADFWEQTALAFLRYGQTPTADLLFRRVTKLTPQNPRLPRYRRLLKLMRLREKEPPLPGRDYFKQVMTRYAKTIRPKLRKYLLAHTLFEKRKYSSCYSKFQDLTQDKVFIRLFPTIWYYYGYCARKEARNLHAFQAFQHYMKTNP